MELVFAFAFVTFVATLSGIISSKISRKNALYWIQHLSIWNFGCFIGLMILSAMTLVMANKELSVEEKNLMEGICILCFLSAMFYVVIYATGKIIEKLLPIIRHHFPVIHQRTRK